ncbi:MAG: hypothetical protein R3D90_02735 [Paracoccaceae bacterium]
MAPDMERNEMQAALKAAQGMAVECVVFDQADRPKRRHLLPLAGLLKPVQGGVSGLIADAS